MEAHELHKSLGNPLGLEWSSIESKVEATLINARYDGLKLFSAPPGGRAYWYPAKSKSSRLILKEIAVFDVSDNLFDVNRVEISMDLNNTRADRADRARFAEISQNLIVRPGVITASGSTFVEALVLLGLFKIWSEQGLGFLDLQRLDSSWRNKLNAEWYSLPASDLSTGFLNRLESMLNSNEEPARSDVNESKPGTAKLNETGTGSSTGPGTSSVTMAPKKNPIAPIPGFSKSDIPGLPIPVSIQTAPSQPLQFQQVSQQFQQASQVEAPRPNTVNQLAQESIESFGKSPPGVAVSRDSDHVPGYAIPGFSYGPPQFRPTQFSSRNDLRPSYQGMEPLPTINGQIHGSHR